MPVKLDETGKCVVEPNGKRIKCHPTHQEALAHMRAINANIGKSRLTLFKDKRGVWNWMGIVSNAWMDREQDILTSDAHRNFVRAIDDGTYREYFDKDTPDLWVWHVPVPVGYATTVAYDERGFLIAAGEGHRGEFYDKVFEGLAAHEEDNPGTMGMSHGMPWDFLEIEKDDSMPGVSHNNIISGYMSDEFTFLPLEQAANFGTGMGGIMVKSMPLEIEDYKRDWFIDTFGADVVAQFDSRLSEIGKAADEAEIPKKEIANMTDSTDVQETVAEETLADDVAEETVEDETATEEESAEDKAEDEEQEDDDDEEKQDEEEEEEDEEEEDKEFVTSGNLKTVVAEIVKGVAAPVQKLQADITQLRVDLQKTQGDLDALKQSEDSRVTDKAKNTPAASLSAIIARTIVGQEGAQIDYNKERTLHQAGPDETEDQAGTHTGISSIDALITKQRGSRKVMAQTNGQ